MTYWWWWWCLTSQCCWYGVGKPLCSQVRAMALTEAEAEGRQKAKERKKKTFQLDTCNYAPVRDVRSVSHCASILSLSAYLLWARNTPRCRKRNNNTAGNVIPFWRLKMKMMIIMMMMIIIIMIFKIVWVCVSTRACTAYGHLTCTAQMMDSILVIKHQVCSQFFVDYYASNR